MRLLFDTNIILDIALKSDKGSCAYRCHYLSFPLRNPQFFRKFKDFLVFKELAGKNKDVPHSNLIPSEKISISGNTIQISDSQLLKAVSNTSVVVNRNEQQEIISIEVLCSCGEKTVITFDYD